MQNGLLTYPPPAEGALAALQLAGQNLSLGTVSNILAHGRTDNPNLRCVSSLFGGGGGGWVLSGRCVHVFFLRLRAHTDDRLLDCIAHVVT